MAAEVVASSLKPVVLGKNLLYCVRHWQEFRTEDPWRHHVRIYCHG